MLTLYVVFFVLNYAPKSDICSSSGSSPQHLRSFIRSMMVFDTLQRRCKSFRDVNGRSFLSLTIQQTKSKVYKQKTRKKLYFSNLLTDFYPKLCVESTKNDAAVQWMAASKNTQNLFRFSVVCSRCGAGDFDLIAHSSLC